jgi:D-xylose 1-dehydrogenase (NADP+, D-xylono-1,4-lactone-forming)
VLAETTPEPDGEDGLVDLQTIEAAYDSADSRPRVEVE